MVRASNAGSTWLRCQADAILLLLAFALGSSASEPVPLAAQALHPRHAGYVHVGSLRMYYQLYGKGRPLVLLHGGGGTIEESFADQIPYFARSRLVVAPEQVGHGRTQDSSGPLSYTTMAVHTAALLDSLHIAAADVLGWSDGGDVGLILAARYPRLVHRLAVTGANITPAADSDTPEVLAELQGWNPQNDKDGQERYARLFADSASHFVVFAEKLKQLWLTHPTDDELSTGILRQIQTPTLVMAGDRDIIRLEHTVSIFRSLPRARLLIVPDSPHKTLGTHPRWLNPLLAAFFEEQ
jgi:pimeloyl-ACP methyl ester carboxylesterase